MGKEFKQKIVEYITLIGTKGYTQDAILQKIDNLKLFVTYLHKQEKLKSEKLNEIDKEINAIIKNFLIKSGKKPQIIQAIDSLRMNDRFLLNRYAALLTIFIFGTLFSLGIYRQFFKKTTSSEAYSSGAAIYGSRVLSFQGRLTDSLSNPITTATKTQFRLYNTDTGGTALYDSGLCTLTPDQDGIFSVLIGKDCGSEIANSIFTENQNVYLGITAGTDSEMKPRQQIANVAYAINAETLQGLPRGTRNSSVPYINA